MNDLVSRSALRDLLYEEDAITMRGLAMLNTFPTVDAVEVVRCEKCIRHNECKFEQYQGLNGFCSLGERKTDETK